MSDKKADVTGAGTVLRGNFAPRGSNSPEIEAQTAKPDEQTRLAEDFERAARDRIGGSIAFVTRLKKAGKDPLFWDEDDK